MADGVIVAETPAALAERVAEDFSALTTKLMAGRDRIAVALAGGQTPRRFYERLARPPYVSSVPWSCLWFFWGDERCVPKEHPDSNFRMAAESLLQHVPVLPSQVVRMQGEKPPPEAAKKYEEFLRRFFRDSGSWPRFDLVILGLGADGHTASLFPGSPAVVNQIRVPHDQQRSDSENDQVPRPRWVVQNVVHSLRTVRLTVTFPVINQAKHVWFLVSGTEKAEAFSRVQKGPDRAWPASLVQPKAGELRWYVDQAVVGR